MYKVDNQKYAKFFELKEETNRLRKEIVKEIMRNNMINNNATDNDKEFFDKNFDVLYECLIPSFEKGYLIHLSFFKSKKEFIGFADFNTEKKIDIIKNMGLTIVFDKIVTHNYLIDEPLILKMFK